MRSPVTKLALLSLLSAGALPVLNAQDAPAKTTEPAPAATYKQAFLFQLGDTEKKLTSLAQAIPQEKYAWRPAEGVRSVSEVFMHEAGANVFFMTFLGVKPPAGFNAAAEKTVTDQAKVVQALKDSFAHVRTTVSALSDEDMQKTAKFMGGRMTTYQNILFFMANHMHEHLGQAIAYARMNNVTPPWSKGKEN